MSLTLKNLPDNVRCIITENTSCGTLKKKDEFYLKKGVLVNITAGGWLEKEDLEKIKTPIKYKIDVAYGRKRIAELDEEIKHIKKRYGI